MGRAAAAAALLRRELDGLNGGTRDATRGNDDLTRSSGRLTNQLGNQDRTMQNSTRQIDRYSGRLALIGQAVSLLGPAAIPIGALAVPAVAGLAAQLGFAAAAGGTAILAFQGVGDALKIMNKAHLEPTAANLQAAQVAMEGLGPAAQHLVRQLHSLGDEGKALRDAAAEGFLPGVSKSLNELQSRGPQVERILREIGDAAGDALAGGAASLASNRWDDFFNFLETDARSTLSDLAESVGNVTHALAELLMATDPLADGFSGWLVTATERLDKWASGLSQTQGFQDFINYVQTNGPQVAETVGAIGSALVDIVTAAAPIGGPILQGLEALAKVVSMIADSDLGTPLFGLAAALSALSLAQRGLSGLRTTLTGLGGTFTPITSGVAGASTGIRGLTGDLRLMRGEYARMGSVSAVMTSALSNTTGAAQRTRAAFAGVGKSAALLGGLALVTSGVAGDMGVMNTVMGATTGLMLGGPWGAAIGGGIGLVLDFAAANKDSSANVADLTATLDAQTGAITENTRAKVAQILEGKGILQEAQASGIALDTVTDAALGQADAFAILDQAIANSAQADIAEGRGTASGPTQGLINLRDHLAEVAGQTDEAVAAGKRFGEAMGGISAPVKEVADAFGLASQEVTDFAAAVTAANEVLSGRAALSDYEAAIDAVTASLKENGRTLDITNDKGRANDAALRQQASTAIAYAQTLGRSNRIRFMQRAREDIIDAAKKLGMGAKAARDFANELQLFDRTTHKVNVDTKGATDKVKHLGDLFNRLPDDVQTDIRANGIPKTMKDVNALVRKYGLTEEQRTALIGLKDGATKPLKALLILLGVVDKKHPSPKVIAETGAAASSLQGIINQIAAIHDKTVNVSVVTTNYKKFVDAHGPPVLPAAGGLILGPGTKTSDSIPARLSTGEYVVKAAAVDKYGASFMHRVNAMQFASGGEVNRAASTAASGWPTRLVVHGTLKTPWGPAEIEGIATDVYERNSDADRKFERTRAGR